MQKNMTDMEDKETFAHSPRAPGPLLSVIPLSSLLLWAEAPDAVARLTRGWADGATCLPSVSPALLGTRSHLLLPHPSRPPHPPPGRPPQCTRGAMSQHCKSGMSPNGTSRWHYRLSPEPLPWPPVVSAWPQPATRPFFHLSPRATPPSQGLVHAGPFTAPFRSTYRHKPHMHEHGHGHTCPHRHTAAFPAPPPEQWGWGAPDTLGPTQPSFQSPGSACDYSSLWASLSPH